MGGAASSMTSIREQVRVGGTFNRENVLHFIDLLRRAEGDERRELERMTEAFSVLATTPEEILWFSEAMAHTQDDLPLDLVSRSADLRVAENRELMLRARAHQAG